MAIAAIEGTIIEGGGAYLMARIVGMDLDPIVKADITSISFDTWKIDPPLGKVFPVPDRTEPEAITEAATLDKAVVIFDELQTDDRWTKDDIGYNFGAELGPGNWYTTATTTYPDAAWIAVDVKFTPAAGEPFFAQYILKELPTLFGKG